MTTDYTFNHIKAVILQWYHTGLPKLLSTSDQAELTRNEPEVLLIDLTFQHCLAQISVSDPFFAPYQYVSFEAMTLDSRQSQITGTPDIVYIFYDSQDTSQQEVLDKLAHGIKCCSAYIPPHISPHSKEAPPCQ